MRERHEKGESLFLLQYANGCAIPVGYPDVRLCATDEGLKSNVDFKQILTEKFGAENADLLLQGGFTQLRAAGAQTMQDAPFSAGELAQTVYTAAQPVAKPSAATTAAAPQAKTAPRLARGAPADAPRQRIARGSKQPAVASAAKPVAQATTTALAAPVEATAAAKPPCPEEVAASMQRAVDADMAGLPPRSLSSRLTAQDYRAQAKALRERAKTLRAETKRRFQEQAQSLTAKAATPIDWWKTGGLIAGLLAAAALAAALIGRKPLRRYREEQAAKKAKLDGINEMVDTLKTPAAAANTEVPLLEDRREAIAVPDQSPAVQPASAEDELVLDNAISTEPTTHPVAETVIAMPDLSATNKPTRIIGFTRDAVTDEPIINLPIGQAVVDKSTEEPSTEDVLANIKRIIHGDTISQAEVSEPVVPVVETQSLTQTAAAIEQTPARMSGVEVAKTVGFGLLALGLLAVEKNRQKRSVEAGQPQPEQASAVEAPVVQPQTDLDADLPEGIRSLPAYMRAGPARDYRARQARAGLNNPAPAASEASAVSAQILVLVADPDADLPEGIRNLPSHMRAGPARDYRARQAKAALAL